VVRDAALTLTLTSAFFYLEVPVRTGIPPPFFIGKSFLIDGSDTKRYYLANFIKKCIFVENKKLMTPAIQFPLNDIQVSLLKMTENLPDEDLKILKRLIIAFKAQRLAELVDKVWEEKGWTEDTMQTFLNTHMRTPYKAAQQRPKE
jgi:hypothetical protein